MTQKTSTKELIHRAGSERALISICLNKPDQFFIASSSGLLPSDFAVDGHKYIWMAMAYLIDQGDELDPVSITNVYTDEGANEAIKELGGIEYLEAMKSAPVAPNTGMYINHIRQASARRAIYNKAEGLKSQALKDKDTDLNDFLSGAETKMRDVAIEYQVAQDVQRIGEGVGDRLKERLLNPESVIGLKTGWKAFDLATLGLLGGELTIIGARSKVGKSTTVLNWSKKICIDDGIPTMYIDTEMFKDEQEDRLLSMMSGVPESEIINGMFGKDTINGTARDKIAKVQDASKQIKDAPFYHVYMPSFSLEKIQALVRKYQIEYDIQLVIFDYIKLPSSNSNTGDKEYQALGYLTSGLKDMAGLLKIPVVSAVQLNRSAVGAEDYDDSMIAGSDRILQLANRVCFLRWSSEEEFAYTGASHQFKIYRQRRGKPLEWTPIKTEKECLRQVMIE